MSSDTKILPKSNNNSNLTMELQHGLDRISPVSAINRDDLRNAHGKIQQLQLDNTFSAREDDKKIDPKSKGI